MAGAFAGLVLAVTLATAVAAQEAGGGAGSDPAAESSYEQWRAERDARRDRPGAREERVSSRDAHSGESDETALTTARDTHPEVTDSPLWEPAGGERVEAYLGERSGLASFGGRTSFFESTLPVRARQSGGPEEPVDLQLDPVTGGHRSRNPLAPVLYPARADAAFRFERAGVGIRLSGARAAAPRLRLDRLFYASVLPDTDLVTTPQPTGMGQTLLLRSAASPEHATFTFDLPRGASVEAASDGGGAVHVKRGADKLVTLLPPAAWDADGIAFDTRLEVDGSRVVLRFPHREQDLRYPLAVDPFTTQGFYDVDLTGPNRWAFSAAAPTKWDTPACTGCRTIATKLTQSYALNEKAELRYVPQGDAFAWRMQLYTNFFPKEELGMYQGLRSGSQGPWWSAVWSDGYGVTGTSQPRWTYTAHEGYLQSHCIVAGCNPPTVNTTQYDGTQAVQGVQVVQALSSGGEQALYSATVFVDDSRGPLMEAENPQGSEWLQSGIKTVTARATDSGLGIRSLRLDGPGIVEESGTSRDYFHGCEGTAAKPCPNAWETTDPTYPLVQYDVSKLPEGLSNYVFRAYDLSGRQSNWRQWTVKVDRTPPQIELGGRLARSKGRTLYGASYDLEVTATDGTPANDPNGPGIDRRSGVQKIEVFEKKVGDPDPATPTRVKQADPGCADNCKI